MKISDLNFETASCCGTCFAATVTLDDGRVLGLVRRDDDLFNVAYYGPGGLLGRESEPWTADQVEALLPKT